MARVEVESRATRSKMWTYMIAAFALIVVILLVNVVFTNPVAAKHSLEKVVGLPGWSLALIVGAVGLIIFVAGLKVEADWPEHLGAFLIAGAVAAGEIMFGWHRLEFGLVVLPYLLPPLVLVILYIIAMKKSE